MRLVNQGRLPASILCLCTAFVLGVQTANATILLSDDFAYADGSLVPNGGWVSHSGTVGDLLVSGGQAVVTHGVPSEDAHVVFGSVSGVIYFGFDFSVDDLGHPYAGTDNEYFAHLMLDPMTNFAARVDIVEPTGAGDFSVGIATTAAAADATWAADLNYATTYRVVVRYDQDLNTTQLWINPALETDTSILGADGTDPGSPVDSFALRQSDSSENETIRVDNLCVATTFEEARSCIAGDPTGGCDSNTAVCTVTTQADCTTSGGTYLGDGIPCPTGACDLGGNQCAILDDYDCETLQGGTYLGDGVACPTGACVLTSGACIETTSEDCANQGGTFQGNNTSCPAPMSTLLINEVDSDQAATGDPGEFVELYNTSTTTSINFAATPYVLVFFNGNDANNASYLAIELNFGTVAPQGYYTVGTPDVLNVDFTFCAPSPCGNLIQNGADAVALYVGTADLYPNGTPPTMLNLADAVVYDTSDADDADLLAALTPGQLQINEDAVDGTLDSIQRCLDGAGGPLNTSQYGTGSPTPGGPNACSSSLPQGACLLSDGVTCIVTDNFGCQSSNGTYLGDGVPCSSIGACTVAGNCFYTNATNCATAGGSFAGEGSSCTGACCDVLAQSCTNDVTAAECSGSNEVYLGDNTDCSQGCPTQPTGLTLNEIRRDRIGADTDYVEIAGMPGTSLDGVSYVEIGDGAGGSGVVENVIDLTGSAIPGDGVLLIADASTFNLASPAEVDVNVPGFTIENSDNKTHLLVFGNFAAPDDDLDTNDDCVLDLTPWVAMLDRVATIIAPNDNLGGNVCSYGTGPADTIATNMFPGYPTHILRLPNANGTWRVGPFDPSTSAVDTPGTPNVLPSGACCLPNDTCVEANVYDCGDQNGAFRGDFTSCMDPGICDCSTIEDLKLLGSLNTGYILCDVTVVETVNQGGDFADDRSFTVQDQSGINTGPGGTERGIRIVGDVVANPDLVATFDALSEGDIITVVGTLEDVAGTLYLRVTSSSSITVTGTGGVFNVPTVSAADFTTGSLTGENLESVRVRVPCIAFLNGGGMFVADASFPVTDGTTTFDVRINGVENAAMPVIGTTIPSDVVDVVGVFSQFNDYQLFLHEADDILAPSTCAGQIGACCQADGTCIQVTQPICGVQGIDGTFQGVGVSCTPNPCVAATGACCVDSVCTEGVTQADCTTMGGEYLGDDSTCVFGCLDPGSVVINEIRVDQPSTDNDEYFELKGAPGTPLDSLTYIVIGDGSAGSGVVEAVVPLSGQTIQSNGLFLAAKATFSLTGTVNFTTDLNFENSDNVTHMIVKDFLGAQNDDLDTDDDCVLDVMPWSAIIDSVALVETPGSGDCIYGTVSVGPDGSFVPGHVYRCDADPNGPWIIGPFDPAVGEDTPGAENPCTAGACCFDGGARGTPCECPGNFDDTGASMGVIDLADLPGFVASLLTTGDNCADINGDSAVNGLDIAGMVGLVLDGATCVPPACQLLSEEDCTVMGGTFIGAGITCDPDPCGVTGACCDANTFECADVTADLCASLFPGRSYLGDGTSCAADCQIEAINIIECGAQTTCNYTDWCAYQVDAIDLAGSTCNSVLVQQFAVISIPCSGQCQTGQLVFRWVDGSGPGQDCVFTATYIGGTPACGTPLGSTFDVVP